MAQERSGGNPEELASRHPITSSSRLGPDGSGLLLAHLVLDHDAVPLLDLAEHLEGAGDDFRPHRRAIDDLDHQLAGEPALDLLELELAALLLRYTIGVTLT
jgi:hypothetical protein